MTLETYWQSSVYDGPEPGHTPTDSTDQDLAEASRAGDLASFDELVRRYRNDVFRFCHHFVRNREDAWDLAQETFVKAYSGIRRFRGEAPFKAWLLRIAANQCKDFLKKRRLSTVSLEAVGGVPDGGAALVTSRPDSAAAATELGTAILAAVHELPFKQRNAFVLREFEGQSYTEMADTMGCSLGTVMSRLHHARRRLRQALEQRGYGQEVGNA